MLSIGINTACEKATTSNSVLFGSKVTATNIQGLPYFVKSVTAELEDDYYEESSVVAQAPIVNNGFTIELPNEVHGRFLFSIYDEFEDHNIVISDRNAKLAEIYNFECRNAYDNEAGYIFYDNIINSGNNDYTECTAFFMYADRNVSVKGEFDGVGYYWNEKEIYDLNLTKGWNIVYGIYSSYTYKNQRYYEDKITSTRPTNVNLLWNYYDDYKSKETSKPRSRAIKAIFGSKQ